MTNKILITGATGNIGKPLVAELKALGADFDIMSSKPQSAENVRVADFNDVASLKKAFAGVDTLFLLFPLVENKLQLARNAAEAAVAAGVKHIVRSSGAGADASSAFALPRLQGQIDDVLKATGIPTTFLRPGGFMQNYVTYQSQAIKDGTIYIADGGKAQALIDARDIAAVAARVLTNPTAHTDRAYMLTGGADFTGVEAAEIISKALGKTVSHVSVPTEAAVATMKEWQMPAWLIDIMDSLNQIVSAGYAAGVSPDVENILGRKPRTFAAFANENVVGWK
ncbi:MAG: SDR family oxidoreductase [Casimicrobium sp.]